MFCGESAFVSVIVPVYNREKTISACLNSIIYQDYVNIEIIIIDDGSTVDTYMLCTEFLQRDKRIILYHQDNGGVSKARNKGLEMAKGEYIMFVDSDDILDSHMIANMLKYKKKNILVMCGYYYRDIKCKEHTVIFEGEGEILNLKSNDFWKLYSLRLSNAPWAKLYEREIIYKNRIKFKEGLNLGEDLLFNLSYLKYIEGYCFVNQPYYFLNTSEDNRLSQKWNENLFEIQVKLYDSLIDFCKDCIRMDAVSYMELYKEYFKVLISCIDSLYENKQILSKIKNYKVKELICRQEFGCCIQNLKEYWGYLKFQDKLEIFLIRHKWYYLDYFLRKVWRLKLKIKRV